MALTFTAQATEGDATDFASMLTTLKNSGTGLYVAGYVDGRGVARNFIPQVMEQATAADNATKWFPQVSASSAIVSSPNASDNAGPLKLVLAAETADTVLSSSVMTVILDRFATVITVTGTV
jgi:hypothetical protein